MKRKILYKLYIINNLQIDTDCITVTKRYLFNLSVAVAQPPPIDIVKKIGLYTHFTYNDIKFQYVDFNVSYKILDYKYLGKWDGNIIKGYKYHKGCNLSYIAIIGYHIIENGPLDTFICYK
jgi:hypothetical protein